MRVGVYIRVDLGVDLRSQSGASLGQKQLLVGDVLLVRKAVFITAGGLGGQTRAGSLAAGGGQALAGGESGRGGRGAVALRVAEPEEGRSQDEGDTGWYPDDDGPGQAGGCRGGDRVALGLQICKSGRK